MNPYEPPIQAEIVPDRNQPEFSLFWYVLELVTIIVWSFFASVACYAVTTYLAYLYR